MDIRAQAGISAEPGKLRDAPGNELEERRETGGYDDRGPTRPLREWLVHMIISVIPSGESGTRTWARSENCHVRSDGLIVDQLGVHDLMMVASGPIS